MFSSLISFSQYNDEDESQSINLLVVTGGQTLRSQIDLVPTSFYNIFTESTSLKWDHATQDEAAFQSERLLEYDVILLYNRSDTLSTSSKMNLKGFLEAGKGLIVLHHSLGSYNQWDWWYKQVVGAKYQMKDSEAYPKSDYLQGEVIKMIPVKEHPITSEIGEFTITDETYKKLWISDEVEVLYRTDNKSSDGPTVWIGPYKESRVLVIQPGHDASAHLDDHYQKLIRQAIYWVSTNGTR